MLSALSSARVWAGQAGTLPHQLGSVPVHVVCLRAIARRLSEQESQPKVYAVCSRCLLFSMHALPSTPRLLMYIARTAL